VTIIFVSIVAKSERNYEKLGKVCEEKVNVEKKKMMVFDKRKRKNEEYEWKWKGRKIERVNAFTERATNKAQVRSGQ
jgi:hypothetical protein